MGCDWQPVIGQLAVAIGVLAPGVLALLVALSNRATIAKMPGKRSTDRQDGGADSGSS